MVRKVTTLICVLAVVLCFSIPTQAASYDEGDFDFFQLGEHQIFRHYPEAKVLAWAESIVNSLPIGTDYIFGAEYDEPSHEYFYYLVVSDDFKVEESDAYFYCITSENAIIHYYNYWYDNYERLEDINYFEGTCYIEADRYGMISSLEDFPEIVERSYYAETLNTILLVVLLLSFVLSAFFRSR